MGPIGCMVAYALFVWWFSTGAILFLNHLPAVTFRWSMAAVTVIFAGTLICLSQSTHDVSIRGAYAGFTCGVWAWGWHEMSFFMGFVTGPRRSVEPPSVGWNRFWQASKTMLYHQAAIALTAIVILLLSAGAPNKVAAETFLVLWLMRISANLNLFLGVRNLNDQFLPPRLAYLKTYMRRRNMNWLLPFSLAGGAAAAAVFVQRAAMAQDTFDRVSAGFIAAMLILATVEHAFMVIPLPFAALWNSFVRPRGPGRLTSVPAHPSFTLLAPERIKVAHVFAPNPTNASVGSSHRR